MNQKLTSILFRDSHAMLDVDRLQPLAELNPEQLESIGVSESALDDICKQLEIDASHLYGDPGNQLYPFCYWDGFFYYAFHSMDKNYILDTIEDSTLRFGIAEQFRAMKTRLEQYIRNQEWESALNVSDKRVSFLLFKTLCERIPEHERKAIFLTVYERNEYGFDRLEPDGVRRVLELDTPDEYDIGKTGITPDADGMITIYRGVTPESTPLDSAYSWTLDRKVAQWFALRFGSNGDVLTARVRIQDVKAYLDGRNESEVLVYPENVVWGDPT